MARIADGQILTDVQVEIAAAGSENERAGNRRSPDNLAVDEILDVLKHRVPVISRLGEGGVGIGAQQYRVGSIDAGKTQLVDRVGYRVGVLAHVGGQRLDRVAGSLADALDAACGIAIEDRTILGKGDRFCRVLCWLPVRVIGAPFDVVDHLAVEVKWYAEFDQGPYHPLPGNDVSPKRCYLLQMASADGRQRDAARAVQIDHAAAGEIALESTRHLLFDLRPRRIGDWRQLAVQIIHDRSFPLSEPMPREPSGTGGVACGGEGDGAEALGSADG